MSDIFFAALQQAPGFLLGFVVGGALIGIKMSPTPIRNDIGRPE